MKTNAEMSRTEKLEALASQINGIIRRHYTEWEFTTVEIVGILELVKIDIVERAKALLDEQEEGDLCEN